MSVAATEAKPSTISQVITNRTRVNSLKLPHRRFRLVIRKNFFTQRVTKHWNRLPRGVMRSLPPEALRKHVDVALKTWFSGGLCSVGLMAGLDDPKGLFQA